MTKVNFYCDYYEPIADERLDGLLFKVQALIQLGRGYLAKKATISLVHRAKKLYGYVDDPLDTIIYSPDAIIGGGLYEFKVAWKKDIL